jgi:tetratricopeptide (TPR) repeat protein
MSEAEQQGIHRRIGGVLERLGRHYPQVVLESLAWHFEQGRSAGKGYAYLGRAGSKRLERGFMMDAADFFARALALEPEARQHLPLDEADHKLGELLLARASALEHLGRWEETTADLSRALQLGEELQDNRLKARACGELGQQARQQGEGERALQHALEAIRLADAAGDPILRITPLQVLAGVNWNRGDLEEARRYWTELLAVGESSRDQRAIAFGYNGLGLAALCKGQTAEARRSFEQSASVFETLGLVGPLGLARGNLVEIHHFTGNMRRGLELSEKARQHARETHNLPGEARSLCYKALILNDLERHDEAVAAADEGLRQMLSQADLSDELFARVVRLRAAFSLMDWDRIADELDACAELLPQHDSEGFAPLILAWRARVVARQDQAEARRLLLEAQSWTGRLWPYQECRLDLALARGYADVGDSAEATRRAEAGIRRADACGFRLYALKGHCLATLSADEAAVSRHRRIADGLAKSLAASLSREDAERFLSARWLHPEGA